MADINFVPDSVRDGERWVAFEAEARSDPEVDWPYDEDYETIRDRLLPVWNSSPVSVKAMCGVALEFYLDGKKTVADAKNSVESASNYRGAPDDEGEEVGGRPRFEYYEERQKWLLDRLKDFSQNVEVLRRYRVSLGPGDFGDQYCKALLKKVRNEIEDKKREIKEDFPSLAKQAQKKLQILGKRKRDTNEDADIPFNWDVATWDINRVLDSYKVNPVDLDLTQEWKGGWVIGQGGYGQVSVWVQNDGGKIGNRIVIKESLNDPDWKRRDMWTGGNAEPPSILTEVDCHLRLRDKSGSSSICRMFGWNLQRVQRRFRLYLEYCQWGSLAKIVDDESPYSLKSGQQQRGENPLEDVSNLCQMLPEAFLWHALETFTLAGLLMHRGKLNPNGDLPWQEIIHQDIKPDNVLVAEPSPLRFTGYPELKLGDFGLAYVKREWEYRRPRYRPQAGTPKHQAPEQLHLLTWEGLFGLFKRTKPLTSKTNVWGIGMLMWSMIAGEYNPGNQLDFQDELGLFKEPPEFDATAQAFYSKDLLNLVRSCTRYNDEDRPSFDAIMQKVMKHTSGGPNERADGLRNLPRNHARYLKTRNEFNVKRDPYPLQTAIADLPPEATQGTQTMTAELKKLRRG